MNMNRSGHHEMRDPDWYGRNADRAKLSPNTLDTESLGGSLNSLNLSFNNIADDHGSVRSLPVFANSGASIAASVDAPWNQSPQSLRTSSKPRAQPRTPSGMSALDHLENSISSLRTNIPPMAAIITEEEEGSLASMNFEDPSSAVPSGNNEMDATAHAGNRSHQVNYDHAPAVASSSSARAATSFLQPISPLNNQNDAASYDGSSITSVGRSWRPSRQVAPSRNNHQSDEQSLSTLGDGEDDFDGHDDDNLSIIKLLRHQVEALKGQLLAEQEKQKRRPLERSSGSFGHDYSSDADSFGGDDSTGCVSNSRIDHASSFSKLPDAVLHDAFAQAHTGISSAVQSIRESWQRRAATSQNSDDENLVDELVLCELEAHSKAMQREYVAQQVSYEQDRGLWEKQSKEQERRIAELKRKST